MSFKKNKYIVIKEAVPKDIAEFVYNYFLMKRQVAKTLFDERYIWKLMCSGLSAAPGPI